MRRRAGTSRHDKDGLLCLLPPPGYRYLGRRPHRTATRSRRRAAGCGGQAQDGGRLLLGPATDCTGREGTMKHGVVPRPEPARRPQGRAELLTAG